METEKRELAMRPSPADDAALMISSAIEKGISADGIEKLADVYLKMKALQAEQEFTVSLLAFQDECPPIVKSQAIKFQTKRGGTFDSVYAPLPKTVAQIRPLLRKHGFTFTFNATRSEKQAEVTCRLSHVGGHATHTNFQIPIESAPLLSDAHSAASAVSFAERYALQLALGLVPQVDDDGKAAFTRMETVTEAQVIELQRLLEVVQPEPDKFWKYVGAGVTKLEEIAAYDFGRIKSALQRMRKGNQ